MAFRIGGDSKNSLPDERLLQRYTASGEIEILGILYARYMPMVYGVCLKYLKEREAAQDAVMDIFEKLVTELGKHSVDNFRSWLYVMTKNWCLMELRSASRWRKVENKHMEDDLIFMENGPELHPLDNNNGISDRALEDCIEKLKEDQMKCVRLFYFENRCYREIALVLNMEEKKVKSYLQNAKRNLKICLETSNG